MLHRYAVLYAFDALFLSVLPTPFQGLWELWWTYGSHVLLCYAFGAAFTAFYRLVGPFQSHKVLVVIKTELWETITRRGLLGNLIMGVRNMYSSF